MELTAMVIFRLIVIPIGLLFAFFSYSIYNHTRGGSRGWMYMAIAGISFSAWAIVQILFGVVLDNADLRMGLGSLLYGMIVMFAPAGPIKLAIDMKLSSRARMITIRRYVYYIVPVMLVVSAFSVMDPYINALNEVISLMHVLVAFSLIAMSYTTFYLWRETENRAWFFIFFFVSLVSLSTFMGAYSGGCCNSDGYYYGNPVCSSYGGDYVNVIPLACNAGILPVTLQWNVFQIVSVLSGLIGFYLLWKPMNM